MSLTVFEIYNTHRIDLNLIIDGVVFGSFVVPGKLRRELF